MKKKLLLGLSSLTMLNADGALLNNLQPEIIDQQNLKLEEVKINEFDQKTIKDFYEQIKYTNIISSLGMYSLKSYKLHKTENDTYKVSYDLENEFKKVTLFFPAVYEEGNLKRVVPIFYDTKEKELKTYELKTKIKPFKAATVNNIFPNSTRIVLNNPNSYTHEKIIFIEPETPSSMNYLVNMYNDDQVTLKDEYKKTKVSLVLTPFNYYSEKNSLQISALVKEYNKVFGNIDIYLEYIKDSNDVMKKIRKKYLEIFKDNFANDYIVEMYKEMNEKIEVLSDYFLMKLVKQIEAHTKTDPIILIKKEQDFIETLMKLDFLDGEVAELSRKQNKDVYDLNKIDLMDVELD